MTTPAHPRQLLTGPFPSKDPGQVKQADLALVERYRAGDAAAFEELYKRHAGRLFNLTLRMAGSVAVAEELLQEVFLQVHRKLHAFKGESALGTWLYRLAMNHCLDYLRGRDAGMTRLTSSLDDEDVAEPSTSVPIGPVARIDLERAIAQLSPGCRAAFLLHDVEGFEHREVADILGIAEGTSKSQVHKARMKLRSLLAP